jgi:hypothetical protein
MQLPLDYLHVPPVLQPAPMGSLSLAVAVPTQVRVPHVATEFTISNHNMQRL